MSEQFNNTSKLNSLGNKSIQTVYQKSVLIRNKIIDSIFSNRLELFFVFSIFLFGFAFYYWIFARNILITGIDGPYYLLQIRSLLKDGVLVYGDPPLAFYILAIFSVLIGDIGLGVKIGVSFFCALTTLPAFFLMKRMGNNLSGYISMFVIIFSASYIRMMTDFMKNAIGMCWLFAFIFYLYDLMGTGAKKISLSLAKVFLILTGLTHILVFAFALLIFVFYTLIVLVLNINRREFLKRTTIIGLSVLGFVSIAVTFFGSLFTDFGKFFSFINSLKAKRIIAMNPPPIQPQPPRNIVPLPNPPPFGQPIPFSVQIIGGWGFVLITIFSGFFLSMYLWKRKEKKAFVIISIITFLSGLICFPLLPDEYLTRFVLMMVVPSAIIIGIGLSKLAELTSKNKLASILLIVFCISILAFQTRISISSANPTIGYSDYLDIIEMKKYIQPNSAITTGGSIGYWVQYLLELKVVNNSPSSWQSYTHILGIINKTNIPPGVLQILYIGKNFALVELQPPKK